MKLHHTDDHTTEFVDEAAMSFMALMVHQLNQTLLDSGIETSEQRQDICENFVFNMAYQWDAGWFIQSEKKLFPMVCFAERSELRSDENLGAIAALHIPTTASSWHEMAHGVVAQYFETDESVADIRTGSYDREN
jgi:hypothetical protein